MVVVLIVIGLCYLGLLACGIMAIVDDIRIYKWRKRMRERRSKND